MDAKGLDHHHPYPTILIVICVDTCSVRNSVFDIYSTLIFGVIGYFLIRLRYPPAPLLLGFILGPMMEVHFRRALLLSRGDYTTFFDSVPSTVFLILSTLFLLLPLWSTLRRRTARLGKEGRD